MASDRGPLGGLRGVLPDREGRPAVFLGGPRRWSGTGLGFSLSQVDFKGRFRDYQDASTTPTRSAGLGPLEASVGPVGSRSDASRPAADRRSAPRRGRSTPTELLGAAPDVPRARPRSRLGPGAGAGPSDQGGRAASRPSVLHRVPQRRTDPLNTSARHLFRRWSPLADARPRAPRPAPGRDGCSAIGVADEIARSAAAGASPAGSSRPPGPGGSARAIEALGARHRPDAHCQHDP